MTNLQVNEKIKEGFKIVVCLTPNKSYDKLILKTYLKSSGTNVVYSIYYNHVKKLLTTSQINNIDLFYEVKNFSFRDKVELNVAMKQFKNTEKQLRQSTMMQVLREKKYTEL
jgi:hypothetical protein